MMSHGYVAGDEKNLSNAGLLFDRTMRRFSIISVFAILVSALLLSCSEEKDPVSHQENTDEDIDGVSMATPDGGKLPSAVEGPVRSALGEPVINLETFQLTISGLVDSSYSLTWDEINELPAAYTDTMIMYCVEGWEVWGNWKGILIKDLLDKAQVQGEGEFVLFKSRDGYRTALPVSYLVKYNAMLAYEVNNAPLQKKDGFPLRLVAFGKYGYKWAKWVTSLEVMNTSQLGYWEEFGFSDQADVSLDRRKFYEGDTVKPLSY
jgi:DMSO/TMAO reductase YedYZ molybdopterin-dependent catalytic subunit